jgi:putative membrane protein
MTMRNKLTIALLATTLAIASPAALAAEKENAAGTNAASAGGKVAAKDSKFVTEAAVSGLFEVEAGKLAQEKGSSDQVKQLGEMMIKDHTAANDELMKIASSKGVQVPTELDAKHKTMLEKLSKQSGEAFDKAYLAALEAAHKKDVTLFEKASQNLEDADLKGFAAKTLPILQGHLEHVNKHGDAHGKKKSS